MTGDCGPVGYVHGYSPTEATRLADQAGTLAELLHHDTHYLAGSRVLEAGCGVGAQTVQLLARSPQAHFTCIDREPSSLAAARAAVAALAGAPPVTFVEADLRDLPFPPASFDHAFVCFVLEHLARPEEALRSLMRMVRPDGTVTVIEGDHGSTFFHPHSDKAHRTIGCLVQAQARSGGDANIGRRLYPLLTSVGLRDVRVSPRFVYADSSRPRWVDGFTNKTFIAMVEGAREVSLRLGLIREEEWAEGIADLRRAALDDGTFCYTFFKATARVP
ncbi:MAG: methyltransferase domain-containing protein [Deltaproteobacteria bacterium]|nr:methyltransferase domain-containing protein [Deltaproteobacteria bacterium]